jgi:hypothetical protein
MMFFSSILSLIFCTLTHLNAYSLQEANASVWLSGSAYCNKEKYSDMILTGPASGFIVTNTLYDKSTDLEGFVGFLPTTKTIYVTFRGSSSILNLIDDIKIRKIPYDSYTECNCSVHKGFYTTTLNLKSQVLTSVLSLKKQTGFKNIILTGHSLGAGISQLMMMEFKKYKSFNSMTITTYNFGQPRIGDLQYSIFVSEHTKNELYRFTHYKDIVPHIPPREMNYFHSCNEIYENENGDLYNCSSINCEDPLCSDQFLIKETNTDDHSIYLGHILSCEESTISNVFYA